MTRPSAVPAIIDALIAALEVALPAWTIVDGPLYRGETGDRIYVGTDDPRESHQAVGSATFDGPQLNPYDAQDETVTLYCTVDCYSGDDVLSALRTRAYAGMEALRGVLAALPSPVACSAVLSEHTLYQGLSEFGPYVSLVPHLTFTVLDN